MPSVGVAKAAWFRGRRRPASQSRTNARALPASHAGEGVQQEGEALSCGSSKNERAASPDACTGVVAQPLLLVMLVRNVRSGVVSSQARSRSACPNRCLTDDGCQRVLPRGVRSRIASSWPAICCSVRSGAAALMPATRRTSRSPPGCGGARSSRSGSTMPSAASRRTVRRRRSTVQARAAWSAVQTRITSPQG